LKVKDFIYYIELHRIILSSWKLNTPKALGMSTSPLSRQAPAPASIVSLMSHMWISKLSVCAPRLNSSHCALAQEHLVALLNPKKFEKINSTFMDHFIVFGRR
jgi:hypothetical protein